MSGMLLNWSYGDDLEPEVVRDAMGAAMLGP